MSATGRPAKKRGGSKAERSPRDLYETPHYTTQALLRRMSAWGWLSGSPRLVDPCAGNGAIIRAANDGGWTTPEQWTASEIEDGVDPCDGIATRSIRGQDIREWRPAGTFDIAIVNPPFSLSMEVILWCLEFAAESFVLQRLNFLGSMRRAAFWQTVMPDVFVLSQRPKFVVGEAGDACEYAWFRFQGITPGAARQSIRRRGNIEILPPVSGDEEAT